eukprot:scaffold12943_cov176-Skeletonema_dohrnii-CCMP3373.AAC.1
MRELDPLNRDSLSRPVQSSCSLTIHCQQLHTKLTAYYKVFQDPYPYASVLLELGEQQCIYVQVKGFAFVVPPKHWARTNHMLRRIDQDDADSLYLIVTRRAAARCAAPFNGC